ncbi:hypothetical protein NECAME_14984 [Necator americanus]|uniref:Uncharacterized protein n=1 Tax=Necator americanus TaxID=51031 RepID=W2SMK9_NECAM|nr:hypothetical protein NECAME_14984 [Necator americanus]ETN69952.1 hypothetical protein NECAME_14984 [Necator americanus]
MQQHVVFVGVLLLFAYVSAQQTFQSTLFDIPAEVPAEDYAVLSQIEDVPTKKTKDSVKPIKLNKAALKVPHVQLGTPPPVPLPPQPLPQPPVAVTPAPFTFPTHPTFAPFTLPTHPTLPPFTLPTHPTVAPLSFPGQPTPPPPPFIVPTHPTMAAFTLPTHPTLPPFTFPTHPTVAPFTVAPPAQQFPVPGFGAQPQQYGQYGQQSQQQFVQPLPSQQPQYGAQAQQPIVQPPPPPPTQQQPVQQNVPQPQQPVIQPPPQPQQQQNHFYETQTQQFGVNSQQNVQFGLQQTFPQPVQQPQPQQQQFVRAAGTPPVQQRGVPQQQIFEQVVTAGQGRIVAPSRQKQVTNPADLQIEEPGQLVEPAPPSQDAALADLIEQRLIECERKSTASHWDKVDGLLTKISLSKRQPDSTDAALADLIEQRLIECERKSTASHWDKVDGLLTKISLSKSEESECRSGLIQERISCVNLLNYACQFIDPSFIFRLVPARITIQEARQAENGAEKCRKVVRLVKKRLEG